MDNKDLVRAACVKANPALLELSFGCKINLINESLMNHLGITAGQNPLKILTQTTDKNVYLVLTKIGIEHLKWRDIDLYSEILGHEPQLSDVLLAIEKKWRTMYGVPENPLGDVPLREGQMLYYIVSKWNLSLSFSEQSEETFAFLAELLK